MDEIFDLFVIGGGINGAGIARDAAGRGLTVALVEKADFAAATSSASSKLIHGGLRYLEYYEFRLVREALSEREVLLRAAPHIIRPMRFILPHHKGLRPAWMLRLGLFLYDHIGGRKLLPPTRSLKLRHDAAGLPLQDGYAKGFAYSDCWVDDARLVILTLIDAQRHGAQLLKRHELMAAARAGRHWRIEVKSPDGGVREFHARALVNAAGPWVGGVTGRIAGAGGRDHGLRLVKGSHIVVPRLYDGDQAYTFQNRDGRIVFAIPYETDFTLIGTTDQGFEGDPETAHISPAETEYLCTAVSEYFRRKVAPDDVVWSYAGVRPLHDDGSQNASAVTRDYVFDLDAPADQAPLLTIYGGKITTFRRLAEHALSDLAEPMDWHGDAWTATAPLPGGEIADADFSGFLERCRAEWPWMPERPLARMARAYGTMLGGILGNAKSPKDLGRDFGAGLSEAELAYLKTAEWADCAEDVLWRRSKLGLFLSPEQREAVERWF